MATRTPASVLELLQRLSFTGPWVPRQDRGKECHHRNIDERSEGPLLGYCSTSGIVRKYIKFTDTSYNLLVVFSAYHWPRELRHGIAWLKNIHRR
ncbi:hypothetical protein AVEN_120808-1 [Araneus ventricosus]|uniref:Uncharacterized protein n=1 Tax=Araneus ventricosus TaxID=182803 RepID=A0A4Y2FG09_ARAVE|nr:hypothetical protein AVEN_120808-1 [Araneus ventricosus]